MADSKNPLAILQDDYKQKLSNGLSSYTVESIGLTVYWKQENMAQRSKYFAGLLNRDMEAFVDVVLHRALNEKGGRMFKPADRDVLLKQTDPDVVVEIANSILGSGEEAEDAIEEASKN